MTARPGRSGLVSRRDVTSAFDVAHHAGVADLWGAWRFAAADSALALKDWMLAGPEEKRIGYDAYLASLDREEQAASVLAERVDPVAVSRVPSSR